MNLMIFKETNSCVSSQPKGQVMMIVVLVLTSVIIGATAVSGLLTARQTRQTTDSSSSAVAISAADAGLEWRVFKLYGDWNARNLTQDDCVDCSNGVACDENIIPPFVNNPNNTEEINNVGVSVEVVCRPTAGPNSNYWYFNITSTAKVQGTSYVFQQIVPLGKR